MMRSEFIKRTGIEPTGQEYAEIEKEYMATDIDKESFCKKWKRNGGVVKLLKQRQQRIEELEKQLKETQKRFEQEQCAWEEHKQSLSDNLNFARKEIQSFAAHLEREQKKNRNAEQKLDTLKAAYAILQGL